MNPLYNQLFNPQYANQDYLQHLHWQQHDTEQRQEIMNAVKAIHDYFDSARKIAPEYQQMAFDACITAVVTGDHECSESDPRLFRLCPQNRSRIPANGF